jgi:hypothetical protein
MAWTTAVDDLRTKISDGPTDKLRALKRVIGQADGSNAIFKTLEYRRITDFTTVDETGPLGLYINGERFGPLAVPIDYDDLSSGFFKFAPLGVPISGAVIEATYYVQWFLDAELESFLRLGANWLGLGDNYSGIAQGLRPAALFYAASESYSKLASRFSEHMSETYRLEDMPDVKRMEIIAAWKAAAKESMDAAMQARDDFYRRQGQSLAPLFGTARGAVRNVEPSR